MNSKKLILASASPRRKKLLKSINLVFEVIPSKIDENISNQPFSPKLIENLALEKALDVKNKINYPAIIIGADTVVVINSEVLGKPENEQDASRMLNLLNNNTHCVISAIAIIDTETEKISTSSVKSEVTFREITQYEIDKYISTREPMDKAGAYAIQGLGGVFVKSIFGCYSNIVGISIYKLAEMLKEFGVITI